MTCNVVLFHLRCNIVYSSSQKSSTVLATYTLLPSPSPFSSTILLPPAPPRCPTVPPSFSCPSPEELESFWRCYPSWSRPPGCAPPSSPPSPSPAACPCRSWLSGGDRALPTSRSGGWPARTRPPVSPWPFSCASCSWSSSDQPSRLHLQTTHDEWAWVASYVGGRM